MIIFSWRGYFSKGWCALVSRLNNLGFLRPISKNKNILEFRNFTRKSYQKDGVASCPMLNNVKSYTYLTKKINYNYVPSRGMRKAAQTTILNNIQKQEISSYLYGFISDVINKTTKKDDILPHLTTYFSNKSLGEFILKQSIAKGFFPTFTFRKKDVLSLVNTSKKLTVASPMEKTDVRFFPEAIIANMFAEQQVLVQQISFNSEKPSEVLTKTTYGGGNYVKDITLTLDTHRNILLDIKTGNNAHKSMGTLGPAPMMDDIPYSVLCTNVKDLSDINSERKFLLNNLQEKNLLSPEIMEKIMLFNSLPIDKIEKNIRIQNEILKVLSSGLIKKNPSFFVGFRVIRHEIEINFLKKMEPYINANNFNSKKDFEILARYSLKAFYESVREADRSKIYDKILFQDTGFDQIDVENLL